MDLGIQGRVAIVGGSSRGLGRAIALALAQEGASVTLFARTEGPLQEAAASIAAHTQGAVHPVPADATRKDHLERVVAETVGRFGRLDIVVNNTGGPPPGTLETLDDAAWLAAFQLNFMSTVRLTRLAVPHMRRNGWGRVINSVSWVVRQPLPGLILSNSLRLGILGLAKTLAQELAPEILVNNALPGWFLTERARSLNQTRAREAGRQVEDIERETTGGIPLGRYGKPEEFASMVTFLASERASYITGQTFLCDGGLVAAP